MQNGDIILLSELNQTEKEKYRMFSLICGSSVLYQPKNMRVGQHRESSVITRKRKVGGGVM